MKVFQVALLGLALSTFGFAQATRQSGTNQSGHAAHSGSSCQDMMKQHQSMMDEMQKMDSELQAKVSAMNRATGDQKVQAIADAVNELAKQRKEMFTRMQEMQAGMMSHMAAHMQSGDKQSMANCPMMSGGMGMMGKQSGPAKEKATTGQTGQQDHQKHHPGE